MIVGNKWTPGLAQEERFFHRAMSLLVSARRLSPQARLLVQSVGDGEAIVVQGDEAWTLVRHGTSVELINNMGRSVGRWLA